MRIMENLFSDNEKAGAPLADLRTQGLLTDDEFAAAKAKLLA